MPSCEKIERRRLFALGCVLGAAVFFLLYGFAPLDVTNDAWLRGGYIEADIQQHYAGWMFYRQSELSLPFCFSDRINWPFGLSVAFTDSIPLFAALFRLLEPLLPSSFQYFGLFTLLCFALQGGFACLLVGLFSRRLPTVLLGALPFAPTAEKPAVEKPATASPVKPEAVKTETVTPAAAPAAEAPKNTEA